MLKKGIKTFKAKKIETKVYEEEGKKFGLVTAYASIFDNVDSYGDVVKKGAFAKTISDHKGEFPILFMHDAYNPVGITTKAEEDKNGLLIEAKIDIDNPEGAKVYSGIKNNYINQMSIGYYVVKDEMNTEGKFPVLELHEIKLLEVSFVTRNFAANDEALVQEVKTKELKRIDELEKEVMELKKQFSLLLVPEKSTQDNIKKTAKSFDETLAEISKEFKKLI